MTQTAQMRETDKIYVRSAKTGKLESITQRDVTITDWGFRFIVDTEIAAYKAAFAHQSSKNTVRISYIHDTDQWLVAVETK